MGVLDVVKPGVLTGSEAKKLFAYAKENNFAIPAVNVVGTDSVNAVLEVAAKVNSPIIIQFSNGGAGFYAGKGLKTANAAVLGGISGANHVHTMAEAYGIPVILHTDHAAKKLLPWIDGLLDAGKTHFEKTGRPLFTSHMLDLSEEPLEENIEICVEYFKKMNALDMMLEIELGITGGEEDGVDNSDVDNALLYTQPEEVSYAYEKLSQVGENFTIAASFGNVHGVYKPGNVVLSPKILDNSQKYIQEKLGTSAQPVDFVFHGGSGSLLEGLKKLPGLIISDVTGMLYQGNQLEVYMDGRPLNIYSNELNSYLEGLPANSIDRIEIITQPGAEFPATSGGAIINIISSKVSKRYLSATYSNGYSYTKYDNSRHRFNNSLLVNAKNNLFGWQIQVGQNYNEAYQRTKFYNLSTILSQNTTDKTNRFYFIKTGLKFDFKKDRLLINYDYNTSINNHVKHNIDHIFPTAE